MIFIVFYVCYKWLFIYRNRSYHSISKIHITINIIQHSYQTTTTSQCPTSSTTILQTSTLTFLFILFIFISIFFIIGLLVIPILLYSYTFHSLIVWVDLVHVAVIRNMGFYYLGHFYFSSRVGRYRCCCFTSSWVGSHLGSSYCRQHIPI